MAGLVAMPLIAQLAMRDHAWRAGWLAIGVTVLAIGFVPVWLLMVRRPEDLGCSPTTQRHRRRRDARQLAGAVRADLHPAAGGPHLGVLAAARAIPSLVYPVQAGVSLHQAANLIEHGITATMAAVDRQPVLADVGCRQRHAAG